MEPRRPIPGPPGDALAMWLRHHDDAAPGLVEGLYVVGSVALDDWWPGSDVDIVALLSHRPSEEEIAALRRAHETSLVELGDVDVDGPRLVAGDLAEPPAPIVTPWTLHREFHHDDGCFELNPPTWHSLASHGVTVRGPLPDDLEIHVDAGELHRFVVANTDSYWRSLADAIAGALADPDRATFSPNTTSWCVLGPARMLHTARTGAIASKTAAGEWIREELPEFGDLADHAIAIRRGQWTEPDTREVAAATEAYVRRVVDLVVAAGAPG